MNTTVEASQLENHVKHTLDGDLEAPASPVVADENVGSRTCRCLAWFSRMRGGISKHPPAPPALDIILGCVGGFFGLLAIASLNVGFVGHINLPLLLGCFGASATLLFGMPSLPVAQPRNIFGGMVVSCITGLFWRTALGDHVWISAPLAVASSIVGMQFSATLHPPGGAAALIIAVMEPLESLKPLTPSDALFRVSTSVSWCIRPSLELTWQERFTHGLLLCFATMLGSLVLFAIALITNNIGPSNKRYPIYWWV